MIETVVRRVAQHLIKLPEIHNYVFISLSLGFEFFTSQLRPVKVAKLKAPFCNIVNDLFRSLISLEEGVERDGLTEHVHHYVGIVDLIWLEQEFLHFFVGIVTLREPDPARSLLSTGNTFRKLLSVRNDCVPEYLFLLIYFFLTRLLVVEVVYDNQIVREKLLIHLDVLVHFENVWTSDRVRTKFKVCISTQIHIHALLSDFLLNSL